MIIRRQVHRRRVLRGMMAGSVVSVGLPLLNCFLNDSGTALAAGGALPVCFGTWFFGLGFTPGRWVPKTVGPGYELMPEMTPLGALKSKVNIYSGMKVFVDGNPARVHQTGPQATLTGTLGNNNAPSVDTLIADVIGTRTRFRSLEVSCIGSAGNSMSRRSGTSVNPSEVSPLALYGRIFGAEFKDPNAADFTPDPAVMVRRSALSAVMDERRALARGLGAEDKVRLDEYLTSLRTLEQQLDLQLQKPEPLTACKVPGQITEKTPGTEIEDATVNHQLFAGILAHALACDQTRVINVAYSDGPSSLRKAGDASNHHVYSHEEGTDEKLGYQREVAYFCQRSMTAFHTMLTALDGIKEGEGTLLDRCLVFASTDHSFAKQHSLENMPMLTAGKAGGRMKTGIHFAAPGDTVTRVGLTVQQALGVPTGSWGTESNHTSKTISEVLA